jgi:hypothetical protein
MGCVSFLEDIEEHRDKDLHMGFATQTGCGRVTTTEPLPEMPAPPTQHLRTSFRLPRVYRFEVWRDGKPQVHLASYDKCTKALSYVSGLQRGLPIGTRLIIFDRRAYQVLASFEARPAANDNNTIASGLVA